MIYKIMNKPLYIQAVLLGLATVLDAAYIRYLFSGYLIIQSAIFILSALLFIFQLRNSRFKPTNSFIILVVYWLFLGFITLIKYSSKFEYLNKMYPIIAFSLLICLVRSDKQLYFILRIWRYILISLLIIDVFTMIIFPNGLYQSVHEFETYTNCWFLGYKTNRLLVTFPLLFFDSYIVLKWKKRLTPSNYVIYLLILFNTIKSDATMGTAVTILYLVGFITLLIIKKKSYSKFFMSKVLMNYKLFAVSYAIIFTDIVLTRNGFIQSLVASYTSKGSDFHNRAPIWETCLSDLSNNLFVGHGMINSAGYFEITNYTVNPHNMMLSFLITGGLIGTALIILYYIVSMKNVKRNKHNALMLFGINLIILLGLTSSIMVYSPYIYAVITIITFRGNRKDMAYGKLQNRLCNAMGGWKRRNVAAAKEEV